MRTIRHDPVRHLAAALVGSGALLLLLGSTASGQTACAPGTEPDRSDIARARAAVATACPCTGAGDHATYERCAAQQALTVLTNKACARVVVACARRSTCGRPGFATCCRTTVAGVTKCSIKRSTSRCNAPAGGRVCVGCRTSCCDACTTGGCAPPRPNIVVVLTDDQRWDTVDFTHSLSGADPVMPITTDRLADHGVTFTNMLATTPLCTPSRTSILTGDYAHRTGAIGNVPAPAEAHQSTVATWLHAGGYRTGFFGKFPQAVMPPVPPGWDTLEMFTTIGSFDYELTRFSPDGFTTSARYGSDPGDYATDVLAQEVVDFIDVPDSRPFFVVLATYAPHAETPLPVPAPADVDTWRTVPPWRPPSYDEADVSDKPAWVADQPRANDPLPGSFLTHALWADLFQERQLEALQAVDRSVGRIAGELEARGIADDTVVVFTSDNGLTWGEHRLWDAKDVPYEESIRLPLVVRYPRMTAGPRTAADLVLNIDLAPTIAELAGVLPSTAVDGQSFVSVLENRPGAGRPDALLEAWTGTGPYFAGVRTERWKYVEWADGETELYDLLNDPYELVSVARDPGNAALEATLAARIAQLRR